MKRIPPILYVLGVLIMIMGVSALISGYGKGLNEQGRDPTAIAVGGMMFGFGALLIAGGLYIAAAKIELGPPGTASRSETATLSPKKFKLGNCALCKSSAAIVRCMTHMVPVCGNCMMKHDNGINCEYIPMARKAVKGR